MPLPSGLTRRANSGVYWIRMRVPVDLHAAVGRRVFTETLGTKDKGLALALFRERAAEIEERYRRLRASAGQEPTQKQIAALAGEFYRSIVRAHEDEPGDPGTWRVDLLAEHRPTGSRRVPGRLI